MRNDNFLIAEAIRRNTQESEQDIANENRFRSWSHKWYRAFHVLPKKNQQPMIFRCNCGRKPTHEQVQQYNVFRCDFCDIQSFDLDYKQSIKKWNRINTPIQVKSHKVSPLKSCLYNSGLI